MTELRVAVALLLLSANATAQDLWTVDRRPQRAVVRDEPTKEIETQAEATKSRGADPAFAHVIDPGLPAPMHAVASMGAAYASTDAATRPLAADVRRGGWVNDLGLGLALHERIGVEAALLVAPPRAGDDAPRWAGRGGARFVISDSDLRLSAIGGYVRDFTNESGPFADLTATWDLGKLRLGSMLHGEKMLAAGRDSVDVIGALGASYRVVDPLRLGAEYVGQDFEDAWEDEEAEGGARHFAGATIAVAFRDNLRLVGGPAVGLTEASPRLLGRASLSYVF